MVSKASRRRKSLVTNVDATQSMLVGMASRKTSPVDLGWENVWELAPPKNKP
jgi:hypothetical protein